MTNADTAGTKQTFGRKRRTKRVGPLLVCVFLLLIVSVRAGDDQQECRVFYGPFSSVVVPPPDCKSPVGLCTHGTLLGEFQATYDFTALTQETDSHHPNSILLTGTSVVTTSRGVIHTDDTSILNVVTGDFVTKAIVHDSDIAEAQIGGFVAAGNLNLATGEAIGTYSAVLCSGSADE